MSSQFVGNQKKIHSEKYNWSIIQYNSQFNWKRKKITVKSITEEEFNTIIDLIEKEEKITMRSLTEVEFNIQFNKH